MLIPRHAEDETGTMLGEIRLGLVNLGFHGDGAFPPMQAALDWVGDADLQSAFLTAKAKGKRKVRQDGMCPASLCRPRRKAPVFLGEDASCIKLSTMC